LNSGIKQRLVGAVVLAALALILWPVVMGPKRDQSIVVESDIPAKPVFGPSEIKQAKPRQDVSPIGEYQAKLKQQGEKQKQQGEKQQQQGEKQQQQGKEAQQKGRSRPALDKDGIPVGWVIQVGSFGQHDNARKLKTRLQAKGFRAQVKTQNASGGKSKYARVFVGPYIDQTIAQRDLEKIAKQLDLKPRLVRYSP
jgi:DedD protein